jgi:Uma2 family endonuclease
MNAKSEATVEDLARVPENGKAELVNGKLVLLPRFGGLEAHAAGAILIGLHDHSHRAKTGYALSSTTAFLVNLPHRKSFCPDASFYAGPLTMGFLQGAPVFAVEVRSESDYGKAAERAMAKKRADYFAAGTLVVWDVDLLGEDEIRSYRSDAPKHPAVFRRGEIASAEPALPGWSMGVDELWP